MTKYRSTGTAQTSYSITNFSTFAFCSKRRERESLNIFIKGRSHCFECGLDQSASWRSLTFNTKAK